MIFVVEMIYSVTYGTCDYGVDIQGIARDSPEPPSIATILGNVDYSIDDVGNDVNEQELQEKC